MEIIVQSKAPSESEIVATNLVPENIKSGVTIQVKQGERTIQSVTVTYTYVPPVVNWANAVGAGGKVSQVIAYP